MNLYFAILATVLYLGLSVPMLFRPLAARRAMAHIESAFKHLAATAEARDVSLDPFAVEVGQLLQRSIATVPLTMTGGYDPRQEIAMQKEFGVETGWRERVKPDGSHEWLMPYVQTVAFWGAFATYLRRPYDPRTWILGILSLIVLARFSQSDGRTYARPDARTEARLLSYV